MLDKIRNRFRQKRKDEKGAIVIEATLCLSFFMFMIVTLLTIVNVCIAQAKIGIALNETAKEISQYSYIYNLTGIGELQNSNYQKTEGIRGDIDQTVDSVVDASNALKDIGKQTELNSETINSVKDDAETIKEAGSNIKGIGDKIAKSEDKSEYVIDVIRLAANEGTETVKGALAGELARGLMQKHLTSTSDQTADAYLRHLGVTDGVAGLDFSRSSIFTNGTDQITLVCQYDVTLVELLNQKYTFHFCQCAKTEAWGAVSLVREEATETETASETETVSETATETTEAQTPEQIMRAKYGDGAIDDIKKAYKDATPPPSEWTVDDWEYHIWLYSASDPETTSATETITETATETAIPALPTIKRTGILKKSKCTDTELYTYLKREKNEAAANTFANTGKWPADVQVPINSKALKKDGSVNWGAAPEDGYTLRADGKADKVEYVPREGEIIDRYGSERGGYASPVGSDGSKYSYSSRSLPYVQNDADYHQYKVVGDFNNIEEYVKNCKDEAIKKKIEKEVTAEYGGDYSRLKVYMGEVAPIKDWGGKGGAAQIQMPLSIEQLKAIGVLEEVK